MKDYSGGTPVKTTRVMPMASLIQTVRSRLVWWKLKDWRKRYMFEVTPVFELDREGLYSINGEFSTNLVEWCKKNLGGSYWVVFNENTYTPIPVTTYFSRKSDLVKFKIVWHDRIRKCSNSE